MVGRLSCCCCRCLCDCSSTRTLTACRRSPSSPRTRSRRYWRRVIASSRSSTFALASVYVRTSSHVVDCAGAKIFLTHRRLLISSLHLIVWSICNFQSSVTCQRLPRQSKQIRVDHHGTGKSGYAVKWLLEIKDFQKLSFVMFSVQSSDLQ